MDHSNPYIAKLEARIDVLETALSTLLKLQPETVLKSFSDAFLGNVQFALDIALITTYPDSYLAELHAYSSHLQARIST